MLLIALELLRLAQLPAALPEEALRLAHQQAANGRVAVAVWLYERVGWERPELIGVDYWMNFGKLNERAGQPVQALFAYRQVGSLTEFPPGEWWLNLRAVRQTLGTAADPPGWRDQLRDFLLPVALDGMVPIAIVLILVAGGLLPLTLFGYSLAEPWPSRTTLVVVPASFLFFGLLVLLLILHPAELDAGREPWLIVASPELLREGNGLSYPPVPLSGKIEEMRLGTEARPRAWRANGWVQVELADGTLGWLPAAAVLVGPAGEHTRWLASR